MRRDSGFTIAEAITVAVIVVGLVLLVLILLPGLDTHSGPAYRTICSTNLSGIYKAMYTYSIPNHDAFAMADAGTPHGTAIGFAEGDRSTGNGATLENNVTASLWMTVRDGSTTPKQWVCPRVASDAPDPIASSGPTIAPGVLAKTHDFSERRNLSYSPMNMYHVATGQQWSANVRADWVIMADNNNCDGPAAVRHTLTKTAPAVDIQTDENSRNHNDGEGQNLLFGDGHVEFAQDPFEGPSGDNVFAMVTGGRKGPPTLGNSDGDATTNEDAAKHDVVLLPLSGNGGGAGSLDPKD